MNTKNPGISALLAFIIPGAGFIYCEKLVTGILAFVFWALLLFGMFRSAGAGDPRNVLVWLALAFLLWAGGIFGSYRTAKEINSKSNKPLKPDNVESVSL